MWIKWNVPSFYIVKTMYNFFFFTKTQIKNKCIKCTITLEQIWLIMLILISSITDKKIVLKIWK